MNRSVLFIHGAWLTPAIWDNFTSRFTACGYTCIAPPWPMRCLQSEERSASTQPVNVGIAQLIEHYASIVEGLTDPPLLVGHGVGGMLVQLLLDRGLGVAGVAISPYPPRCVRPITLAFTLLPPLLRGDLKEHQVKMTFNYFAKHVGQLLSFQEQRIDYLRHIVPAPRRILFEAALGIDSRVNFANDKRAPLLLTVGEHDQVIRASLVSSNYYCHQRSVAHTAYKCFSAHSHWLITEPNWEEVADFSIEWSQSQSGRF